MLIYKLSYSKVYRKWSKRYRLKASICVYVIDKCTVDASKQKWKKGKHRSPSKIKSEKCLASLEIRKLQINAVRR